MVDAGVLQADRVDHAVRRFGHAVRRVAEPRLLGRALQDDGAGVAVREARDARVFLAEADAAREQHDRRGELQAAEIEGEGRGGRWSTAYDQGSSTGMRIKGVPMFHVILFEPEIPPNTGNVIRLCANTGSTLHLVRPLGFTLDDARVKRAGLDYHEMARVREHATCRTASPRSADARVFAVETTGGAALRRAALPRGRCLPVRAGNRGTAGARCSPAGRRDRLIRLPMVPGNRSLNLSNAVAVVVFEAWRQLGFPGS